jgi:hypothetical protein
MATAAHTGITFARTRRGGHSGPRRLWALLVVPAAGSVALFAGALAGPGPAFAAGPGLASAADYSVLAGSAVTNIGPSVLSGDVGVSPGTAITGFSTATIGGATHAGDAQAAQAESDLTAAYTTTAGLTPTQTSLGYALVGGVHGPGVYNASSALDLSGAVTLDGMGDPDAVFVFQVGSALTTASGSSIVLTGGAQACNVFWQVGSSATLGTNNAFVGTVMALTSVTVTTGTTVQGRALARNGAVSLDHNVFTPAGCATTTSPTPTSPSPSTAVPTSTSGPTATIAPTSPAAAVPTASTRSTPSAVSGRVNAAAASRSAAALKAARAAAARASATARTRSSALDLVVSDSSGSTARALANTGVRAPKALLASGLGLVAAGGLLLSAGLKRRRPRHAHGFRSR